MAKKKQSVEVLEDAPEDLGEALKESKKVEPQIMWKSQREFRHDLFKLENEAAQKNVSYKARAPMLIREEHSHVFHSVDRKGEKNIYCAPKLGHFHKIETHDEEGNLLLDAEGKPAPRCGPPLSWTYKKIGNGKPRKFPATIQFEDATQVDKNGEYLVHKDDHRHKMTYLGSEMISPERVRKQQIEDGARLGQMLDGGKTATK